MIRCKPNGKVYVGQSTNIEKRWKDHKYGLHGNYHHCKELQKDWNIYGEDNFEFKVIQKCKEDKLDELEIIHIEQFMAFEKGYNETKGGKGVKGLSGEKHHYYGKHLDDEHKNNISESLKGKPKTEEHKEHIRLTMIENGTTKGENNPNYGKQLSQDTKTKISKKRKSKGVAKGENNPRALKLICIYPDGTQTEPMYQKELSEYLGISCIIIRELEKKKLKYEPYQKRHEHLEGIKIIKVEESDINGK